MKEEIQSCNHIKENGIFCGSPALADRNYCYFHLRLRVRHVAMARARAHGQRWRLDLPALEDMYSVQVALMRVIEALADDQIDSRRAGLILYGLQQAATNLRDANAWGEECNRFEVAEDAHGLAEEYDYMESEFGLPEDAEVDASEGWAFPTPEVEGVAQKSPSSESSANHDAVEAIPANAQASLEAKQSSPAKGDVLAKEPARSEAAEENVLAKKLSRSELVEEDVVTKKPVRSAAAGEEHEVTPAKERA